MTQPDPIEEVLGDWEREAARLGHGSERLTPTAKEQARRVFALIAALREAREGYMAHCSARDAFDAAVLSKLEGK